MFPESVDDALRQTIFDWYQFREICDDEKFDVFFLRVLKENINRYNQILRIQPGIAEYDWLVQRYLESQTTDSGSGTRETTDGRTTTYGGGTTTTNGGQDVRKTDYGKVSTLGGGNEETTTYGKTATTTHNITDSTLHGHIISDAGTISEKTITGHKDVITTDTRVVSNKVDNYRTGDFVTENSGYVINDQKGLAKTNPMSISYNGGVSEPVIDTSSSTGGASATGGVLDWSSPSSQTAQFGRDYNASKTTETRGHELTDTITSVADGGNLTERTDYSNGYAETNEVDKTTTHSGTDSTSKTGTVSDATTGSDKREYKTTETDTLSGSDTISNTFGKTTTTTDNRIQTANGTGAETSTTNSTHRLRHTGRYSAPAQLLSQAASFIMTTDAWEWLYKRLDVCFMGIYD